MAAVGKTVIVLVNGNWKSKKSSVEAAVFVTFTVMENRKKRKNYNLADLQAAVSAVNNGSLTIYQSAFYTWQSEARALKLCKKQR